MQNALKNRTPYHMLLDYFITRPSLKNLKVGPVFCDLLQHKRLDRTLNCRLTLSMGIWVTGMGQLGKGHGGSLPL